MKPKIAIVFILFIVAGSYFIYRTYERSSAQMDNNQTDDNQANSNKTKDQQDNKPEAIKTITINGKIESYSDGKIELKNNETANSFVIDKDVKILVTEEGKIVEGSSTDLKKGKAVSLLINQANSKVLSLQIVSDSSQVAF